MRKIWRIVLAPVLYPAYYALWAILLVWLAVAFLIPDYFCYLKIWLRKRFLGFDPLLTGVKGEIACWGSKNAKFSGEVFIVKEFIKLRTGFLPQGPLIVVAEYADIELFSYFHENVVAILTSAGGVLAHFFIVARETVEKNAAPHLVCITSLSYIEKLVKDQDILEIERIDAENAVVKRKRP